MNTADGLLELLFLSIREGAEQETVELYAETLVAYVKRTNDTPTQWGDHKWLVGQLAGVRL